MDTFLTINLIAFILVVLAALYLFIKAVMTRYSYIQLGQKKEFDLALKDRLRDVLVIVFGQSKLLKDKKSGAIHVMMFYRSEERRVGRECNTRRGTAEE